MYRVLTTVVVVFAAAVFCVGCDSSGTSQETAHVSPQKAKRQQEPQRPKNTKRVKAGDMMDKLMAAGLGVEEMGAASIPMDDLSRFPEEPRSTLLLRISDGQGDSSPMTFVEFGSWKTAATVDEKPINGFAVRNWFVHGTTSKYFVKLVTKALED